MEHKGITSLCCAADFKTPAACEHGKFDSIVRTADEGKILREQPLTLQWNLHKVCVIFWQYDKLEAKYHGKTILKKLIMFFGFVFLACSLGTTGSYMRGRTDWDLLFWFWILPFFVVMLPIRNLVQLIFWSSFKNNDHQDAEETLERREKNSRSGVWLV